MELIKLFPRQVAMPDRVICKSEKEFNAIIDKYNCIKSKIYFSLYNCSDGGNFDCALIDKIAFDLDSANGLDNIKKLHDYCKSKNLKHCSIFSTGGFWFYIFTSNYEKLKNKKTALASAQKFIASEVNLSIGKDPHKDDIDFHIIGDVARVARMPNTFDIRRGIFAIPLSEEDITKGMNHIKNKAKQQSFKFYYYGKNLLDISQFDCEENIACSINIPDGNYDYDKCESDVREFPPCVVSMIIDSETAIWQARWYATIFLREMGYPRSFTRNLLYKYYSQHPRTDSMKNNWNHYKKMKVLELVYDSSRDDSFPNCEKLFTQGYCKGKCKWYRKIYK